MSKSTDGVAHRVHRVAPAAFWRTLHHDGKISPGWWGGGGLHAHPPFTAFTITFEGAVYAPAVWAYILREVVYMERPIEPNMGPSLADVLLCTVFFISC